MTQGNIEQGSADLTSAAYLQQKHEAGLSYEAYLAAGTAAQRDNWQRIYEQATLTDAQLKLLGSFEREIKVLGLSGIWCGDCVQQGPLIQKIAEASDAIDLRWLDRDEHMDLQEQVMINAGHRVPVLVFCAEDYEPVGWFGDRTLNRYRALAAKQLGGACPLPGAPVDRDELAATMQDWLDQFERVHLLLRLSGRLRQKHGD
ncbi:thioredoxin family protein [Phycisphaerales bacterium AB-hyl4]|uniref:Thioredoxin family protein n=1 Tax=Natronomicrosphaera hydrolytica TaxID=3242702 RepID=A0ABV4U6S3_9BACT